MKTETTTPVYETVALPLSYAGKRQKPAGKVKNPTSGPHPAHTQASSSSFPPATNGAPSTGSAEPHKLDARSDDPVAVLRTAVELRELPLIDYGACIYLLMHAGRVVYVGQSISLPARIGTHRDAVKRFDQVLYFHIPRRLLDLAEGALIRFLRPRLNRGAPVVVGAHAEDFLRSLGFEVPQDFDWSRALPHRHMVANSRRRNTARSSASLARRYRTGARGAADVIHLVPVMLALLLLAYAMAGPGREADARPALTPAPTTTRLEVLPDGGLCVPLGGGIEVPAHPAHGEVSR